MLLGLAARQVSLAQRRGVRADADRLTSAPAARRSPGSGQASRRGVYLLGGWAPPLASWIALRRWCGLGGDAAGGGVRGVRHRPRRARRLYALAPEARASRWRSPSGYRWLLLLAVWGALNLAFVSGDPFTLYVALELLDLRLGVPLVPGRCGSGETLALPRCAAILLSALCGSVLAPCAARCAAASGGYEARWTCRCRPPCCGPEPIVWAACWR